MTSSRHGRVNRLLADGSSVFLSFSALSMACRNRGRYPCPRSALETHRVAQVDEEVERREQELESGQVAEISHEEFVRRVQQECGR
jgi:hypothetical protein